MKKFKQCMYTILLMITCFVASPMIFKQIWQSSKEIEPASSKKPPVIDINNKTTEPTENTSVPKNNSENPAEDVPDSTAPYTEPVTTAPLPPAPVFVKSDSSYFDDALFIGDSRTVGIYEYGTLKNADYFCSVGLASYKIESEYINGTSIYDMLSSEQYGKVYIMLGINEVGNDFDYTMNAFVKLINLVKEYQPDSLIYIMGNLHVTQTRQLQGDTINNENINSLNSAMAEFADGEKVFYLDVNEIFDDSDGNLMSECSNDGVHVLAKYYQTWCDWLCMNTVPAESEQEETEENTETIPENFDFTYEQNDENGGLYY
ncbi:MAG: GDSL-type esterase/lipase family protein [Ruminococcus flavefaciens]|nr:GDSL-type esterase/lipase family protein [Ruminococcus flavefaciens]